MKKSTRILSALIALALGAFAFGFVIFATLSTRETHDYRTLTGDGIVVLTGGQDRIQAAAQLLSEKRAKRLLISGVNKNTNRADLLLLSGLDKQTFQCCVDVGYEARNTAGNAYETRAWAAQHKFHRVIVVTSAYHMPRSLMELGRVMPETELVPFSVMPDTLRANRWWLHQTTARILFSEYLKFLPSAARFAASRAFGQLGDPDSAENAHAEL